MFKIPKSERPRDLSKILKTPPVTRKGKVDEILRRQAKEKAEKKRRPNERPETTKRRIAAILGVYRNDPHKKKIANEIVDDQNILMFAPHSLPQFYY